MTFAGPRLSTRKCRATEGMSTTGGSLLSDERSYPDQPDRMSRRGFGSLALMTALLAQGRARSEETAQAAEEASKPKLNKVEFRNVPVFAVTDESGASPYFTDQTKDGNAAGFFFLERADAERVLKTVKKEDKNAKITSVPLSDAWKIVSNPSVSYRGEFHVLSSKTELANANNVKKYLMKQKEPFVVFNSSTALKSGDAYDKLPCFYDEKLASVVEGEPTTLAFFKYEDLQRTWDDSIGAIEGDKPAFKPRVIGFDEILASSERDDTPRVLMVSSEVFNDDLEKKKKEFDDY